MDFILKPKKCKVCKQEFTPVRPLQNVCGIQCAIEHSNKLKQSEKAKEAKLRRKAYKDSKDKIKTLTDLANDAQKVFNQYIRERDKLLPCISCGRHHQGQWHAGHFRSVGAARHLRFNEDNVHKQCSVCNNHKSGNVVEYRINLVKRIGKSRVEALENNNDIIKYTREDLIKIKEQYKFKLKNLLQNE